MKLKIQVLMVCVFVTSLSITSAAFTEITKDGCGKTKGCKSEPTDCNSSKTCKYLVTYRKEEDLIVFELSTNQKWAAIGFNDKPKSMPGSDAVMCTTLTSEIAVQHYDLIQKTLPPKTNPLPKEITLNETYSGDGRTLCKFYRTIKGSGKLKNLDQKHFLVFAHGPVDGDTPKFHSWFTWSSSAVLLSSYSAVATEGHDSTLVKAHGTLMIIGWMFYAAIGIFMARYTKTMWDGKTLLGQKVWFMIHRTLMGLLVVFGTIAIILIFVHRKGWSEGIGAHPYVGIIAYALSIVNPIMALFRPHPGEPKRVIFNWAHRLVGLSAFILAVAALFLAVHLKQLMIKETGQPVMIAFCVGIAVIIVFDIILYLRSKDNEQYSMPSGKGQVEQMEEEPALRPVDYTIQYFMLGFWLLVSIGTTIALAVIVNIPPSHSH